MIEEKAQCSFCLKPIEFTDEQEKEVKKKEEEKKKPSNFPHINEDVKKIIKMKNLVKYNELVSSYVIDDEFSEKDVEDIKKEYEEIIKEKSIKSNDKVISGAVAFSLPCPALLNRTYEVSFLFRMK